VTVDSLIDLPKEHTCLLCTATKPIAEMIVVRLRKQNKFRLRPRCKECHNNRERGHRREWKTRYLRRWRRDNAALNRSYWKQRQAELRLELNTRAYMRFLQNHDAILVQGRLKRQTGMRVTIAEAKDFVRCYGRCYPTRYGLTDSGLRECERIRSGQRKFPKRKRFSSVEIRMMVYDSDKNFVIKPRLQKTPYRRASKHLHEWHVRRGSPNALPLRRAA